MKLKTLAAALVIGASSTAAFAADLPSRHQAPVMAVVQAPIFTWTGFYAGLQAGYAWDKVSVNDQFGLFGPVNLSRNGFVGGGHVGYLFQSGPGVFGVEADLEGATVKSSHMRASVRGRAGIAYDRALFYVTGGLAMASYNYSVASLFAPTNITGDKLGWTVGAGVDYAISQNWSTRIEYRYSDFGRVQTNNIASWASAGRKEHSVRLGVSYHFNSGYAAPVVAKY